MKQVTTYLACFLCAALLFAGSIELKAQDDLLDLIEAEETATTDYTIATFKTTRVINGHSVETNARGVMQFIIAHRFGRLNSGWRDLFGIDNATMRLGFEYGITDRINIGWGRSSFEKTYDGILKFKVLRQSKGAKRMPLTLTALATTAINTSEFADQNRDNHFSDRMAYSFQLMFARKFNDYLSLQFSPTMVHRNLVATPEDKNDVFAMGFGGRVRLTGSLTLNAEYYWVLPNQIESTVYGEATHDALSIGVDLETGGHVFQLHFTNTRGMAEKQFATETTGNWLDGDIHFGFNVSRVFTLVKKPKKPIQTKRAEKRDKKS